MSHILFEMKVQKVCLSCEQNIKNTPLLPKQTVTICSAKRSSNYKYASNVTFYCFLTCRHALDGLYNNLHRINDDLAQKNNSLDLDNKCMDVRQKLNCRPQTTMERNLTLTGIERERSRILA